MIKIAIYEDNLSLLESLSYLIRGTENFRLCTAAANPVHVIDDCKRLCPDVILMDIDMPEMTGIEATRLVKAAFPDVNIMMLTVFEERDKIFEALCAGATGYLLKKTPSAQIISAVEELHRGGSPISSSIARKVLEHFASPGHSNHKDMYKLSPRETEILNRLVLGDSYKMAADACFVSVGTIYSHINSIYRKLHVNSKSEAVIKAIKEKLI
ncbi:MAG: response regulator transcription factor [Tannerella sp.]|jgi:DNA-binding NarL/FixJ family response regulator|nr:response regulator transcription factor [Tannerella sp.]